MQTSPAVHTRSQRPETLERTAGKTILKLNVACRRCTILPSGRASQLCHGGPATRTMTRA